jgi:predicted aldo/keto reductase-like oxidoreductase
MYPINPAFDVIADEERFNSDILGNIWDAAYNYTSTGKREIQPRKNVYSECERKGIGLVAMKPFAGGFILGVEKDAGFTPLNLVSYVLAQNGVSTVIPGCTNPQEIKEILAYYTSTKKALDYSEPIAKSRWSVKGNCLYCNHCLPCSVNINIAEINKLLDSFNSSGTSNVDSLQKKYDAFSVKASSCIRCGECQKRCPFDVEIMKKMEKSMAIFKVIKSRKTKPLLCMKGL